MAACWLRQSMLATASFDGRVSQRDLWSWVFFSGISKIKVPSLRSCLLVATTGNALWVVLILEIVVKVEVETEVAGVCTEPPNFTSPTILPEITFIVFSDGLTSG